MGHHRQPGKRRFRPGRDWFGIAGICAGGILCGVGVHFAFFAGFFYGAVRWLDVSPDVWYPWWWLASHIASDLGVLVFVIAAACYWFRHR